MVQVFINTLTAVGYSPLILLPNQLISLCQGSLSSQSHTIGELSVLYVNDMYMGCIYIIKFLIESHTIGELSVLDVNDKYIKYYIYMFIKLIHKIYIKSIY